MLSDMSSVTYGYSDPQFGIPAPVGDQVIWDTEEQRRSALIGRALAAVCLACGVGVISGGIGSVSGGDVALTALRALIADATGPVPVETAAEVLDATRFAEGANNWIHCQLASTSRADGTCAYYVDDAATPASDAIAIARVTVASGVVTVVDNTVRLPPVIASRIPWEILRRSADDETTLLALLTAILGPAYLDGTRTATVDARLTEIEGRPAGGGGGSNTVLWEALERAVGNPQTIPQAIAAAVTDHETRLHTGSESGGSGGASTGTPSALRNNDAVNLGRTVIQLTAEGVGDVAAEQVMTVVYVPGVWGDGTGGSPNYEDEG
jgi:hypothetical protein